MDHTFVPLGNRLGGFYDIGAQETNYIAKLARDYFIREENEKLAIATVEDVYARRRKMQRVFRESVGELPDRHAPLNVNICNTHTLDDGVKIQNLTYESLPGLNVTGSLWLPVGYDDGQKRPAVLLTVGHAIEGRAYGNYNVMAQLLVRRGFVVLSVDPPGQGERVQYLDENGNSRIGGPVAQHLLMALPGNLIGITLTAFFIRDLERALDILEDLPYVDKARIGITGNSGGGNMSCFMALWDDRLAATAPSCFTSSLEAIMLTGRPQDSEQILPGAIKNGLNHDDFLSLFAPKPFLISAAAHDGTDISATEFTWKRTQRVYALFDAQKNARLNVAPTRHGLFFEERQAILSFLCEVLDAPVKEPLPETHPEPLGIEYFRATRSGRILLDDPGAKTVPDLCREYARTLLYTDCDRDELRARVKRVMATPWNWDNRPYIRFPREISDEQRDSVRVRRIWFFSEGEESMMNRKRCAVGGVLYEPDGAKECVVLLPEEDDWEEKRTALLDAGKAVYLFYPRGMGACKAADQGILSPIVTHGRPLDLEYRHNCDAIMCGTTMAALRIWDAVRAWDVIGPWFDKVSFAGIGVTALYALCSAAITDADVSVENVPLPMAETLSKVEYENRLAPEIPGILREFDLPLLVKVLTSDNQ